MLAQGTRLNLATAQPRRQGPAPRATRVLAAQLGGSQPPAQRLEGPPSLLTALLASACLATAGPAAAELLPPEQVFATTCAGCHAGGGNIVRRDHTLFTPDLEREGLTDVESVYQRIYYGEGSMPGYGADCAPKRQCTFGPRLSDDDIRGLAVYVLDRAAANWAE